MKYYTFIASVFMLTIVMSAQTNAQTKLVDVKGKGKYYNSVWKSWSTKEIKVFVDKNANVYISCDDALIGATGFISHEQYKPFINALNKGLEWAAKAKDSKLETSKEIASFFSQYDDREQGVSLTFFSSNEGQQTDVILKIKDFKNMFTNVELYIEPDQLSQLVHILEKVPATHKELREGGDKADEILK